VKHSGTPLLILAGVGTGKTETLMRKYAYLLASGIWPRSIMCVTFTNKAAREMQERAAQVLKKNPKDLDGSWINTFHSLSLKILKENQNYSKVGLSDDFHVVDDKEQVNVLKELLKDDDTTKNLLMQIVTEERRAANNHGMVKYPPYPRIARVIDSYKNACIYPEDPDFDINKYSRFDAAVFRTVYSPYQELLLIKNGADFGDLI
jgi:DNA helicase-2/ATP-dependent DNA helicase PcrA